MLRDSSFYILVTCQAHIRIHTGWFQRKKRKQSSIWSVCIYCVILKMLCLHFGFSSRIRIRKITHFEFRSARLSLFVLSSAAIIDVFSWWDWAEMKKCPKPHTAFNCAISILHTEILPSYMRDARVFYSDKKTQWIESEIQIDAERQAKKHKQQEKKEKI